MKISIVTLILFSLLLFGAWQSDIAQDKKNRIKVVSKVSVYDQWECGDPLYKGCVELFSLEANTDHQVERIRYGKDYMAIKIQKNNLSGWVTYGKNVKITGKSGT